MTTITATAQPGMILLAGMEYPAEKREDGTIWYQNDASREWKKATTAKQRKGFIPGYQPPLSFRAIVGAAHSCPAHHTLTGEQKQYGDLNFAAKKRTIVAGDAAKLVELELEYHQKLCVGA